jgi:acyl carrier protein
MNSATHAEATHAESTQTDAILEKLRAAYLVVKVDGPKEPGLEDNLVDDLQLDSLDMIDLVSVLEEDFSPDVIDAVIDQSPQIATVAELVDAFTAAATASADAAG